MSWIVIELQLSSEHEALVSCVLETLGAVSITLLGASCEPVREPAPGTTPLWPQIQLSALFTEDCEPQTLLTTLHHHLGDRIHTVTTHRLADTNWQAQSLHDLKPMAFGNKLWICPTQHTVIHPDAKIVHIDPGLAFGSGQHPTTQLCLRWLDQHISNQETLVDYGCGSGILGLAACRLGVTQVFAVDYDEQARLATRENATRNHIDATQLQVLTPKTIPPQLKADVIIANILANPLIALAPQFINWLKPQADLALAGILEQQAKRVIEAYAPLIHLEVAASQDEWVLLVTKSAN